MNVIRIVGFTVIAGIAAFSAAADPATEITREKSSDSAAAQEFDPLPLGVGLRVYIDPATGRLRPPTKQELAAQAEAASASRNKSIEGLVVEHRPDGSKHVDLQGRFMHSLRATVGADGSVHYACSDKDKAPDADPASAPAAPADK